MSSTPDSSPPTTASSGPIVSLVRFTRDGLKLRNPLKRDEAAQPVQVRAL